MKALVLRIVTLLAAGVMTAGAAHAQSVTTPPGLVVLEQGWSRGRPPSPALYEDPLRVSAEQSRLEHAQKETLRVNRERAKVGVGQYPIPQRTGGHAEQPRPPGPDGYEYTYTVRVRNGGDRKIRRVDWDYLVLDAAAGRELGRHHFTSKAKVSPGQTKKFVGRSIFPPSSVIDASAGDDKASSRYSERVIIRRVEYDDGSVWEGAPD